MHFLSVGAIFKNESTALEEWITHYIQEGVDHFYLIDNGSTDNYADILRKYDCITLFKDARQHIQIDAYNTYIYPQAIKETTYLAIFDLDEFAYAQGGRTLKTILLQEPLSMLDEIWCPWLRFGSNGHIKQPASIIQGFTKRRVVKPTILGKSIVKTAALVKLGIHEHAIREGGVFGLANGDHTVRPNGKQHVMENEVRSFHIIVNHYEIQSYDWFHNVKKTRGDVHSNTHKLETDNIFNILDNCCTLTDTTLYDKRYKLECAKNSSRQ